MEINVRTLLPFLLFYFLKESSAQTVHNVFTYTSRLMEELECIFTSTFVVQWTEQREDGSAINLFFYDVTNGLVQKQTDDSKYDNLNYSIEGTDRFNLVIKNVEQDDAGRYQCNPITTGTVTFVVTVEVLPESININCTESNVCMPSAGKKTASEMITCNCTAYGLSSSQLEIQWDAVGINSISNTTFGSSSISSKITLQPPTLPVCILTSVCPSNGTNASLICSCSKGSHVVYGYSFYNSQKLLVKTQSNSTLQVNSDKVETFYCKGCNGVFNSQSEPLELNCNGGSAFPWWIFIIICILLLFAAIFLFKKGRKKPAIHQDEENVEVGKEGGHDEQAATKKLLDKNGDKQNVQEVQGSGTTTPTPGGGPASKADTEPDDKSTSAGSSGVEPGKVTEHENDAARENIEKKKPPVEPKTKGENNENEDNRTLTNRGDSPNQAPLDTERTEGDGKADTDTQEVKENVKDRPSPTNHGKGLLEDPPQNQNPGGTSVDWMSNDSNTPTHTDADSQQKDVIIASAPGFL